MATKKVWMDWHSWVGLKLSLLMLVICFTGTIAVVSNEIDWLVDSDMRIESQNKPINWDGMVVHAQQAFPDRSLNFLQRPLYSNSASIAFMNDPLLGARRVLFDPYTGQVIADKPWNASFQRVFRDLHRYLLSPIAGIYLVGPFAILLLISLVTALMFYKKWWRGFFKLRLNNGPRAFWGSVHKVTGLWSLWFILLMAVTGVWYLAEAVTRDVGVDIQFDRPSVPQESLLGRDVFEPSILPSEAIAIAKTQYDNFEIASISIPTTQEQPYYLTGFTDALLVRARSNSVFIDPVSGDVIQARRTGEQTALEIWIDLADPLHFGDFGGLWTKVIWFIFGAAICALSIIGIWIFIKRIKQRQQEHSFNRKVWGPGRFAVYAVLLIPITFGSIILVHSMDWLPRAQFVSSTVVKIENAQLSLLLSQKQQQFFIDMTMHCSNCLPIAAKPQLLLTDGSILEFKRRSRIISSRKALLTEQQLTQIVAIEWQIDDRVVLSVPVLDLELETSGTKTDLGELL